MPSRNYSTDKYRYGFNGKEKDKDLNSLTAYDYGFRIYNPAIGKFLSVDPLAKSYPWNSVYAFAENNPIGCLDLDGLEQIYHYKITETKNGGKAIALTNMLNSPNDCSTIQYTLTYKDKQISTGVYNNSIIGTALAMHQLNSALNNLKEDAMYMATAAFKKSTSVEDFNYKYTNEINSFKRTCEAIQEIYKDRSSENVMNLSIALWGSYGALYSSANSYYNGKQFGNNTVNGPSRVNGNSGATENTNRVGIFNNFTKQFSVFNRSTKLCGRTIVVDENLSPTLVTELGKKGYNVKIFPKGTLDADIIAYADANKAIVLTNNIRDFNKWGITTFNVSEKMKLTSNVQNVVNKIENINNQALVKPDVIKPGVNVSIAAEN